MRKLFSRYAVMAVIAASISVAGPAHAKYDFDALLADVTFGQEATAPPAAGAAGGLVGTDSAPLAMPAAAPPAMSEQLPVPPAPAAAASPTANPHMNGAAQPMAAPMQPMAAPSQPMHGMPSHVSAAPCGDGCSDCGSCASGKCGGNGCLGEAHCQPYMPPQLPTSTFYQYWRTNSCNVNVWNGFRNRCHTRVDLSCKKKSLFGGSSSGCGDCGDVYAAPPAVDCGPAPAEWCDSGACDQVPACDGCDG
ncbi:MAG: hypothetical protein AAFV88_08900 [Planctomycetota bacterium]